MYRRIHGTHFFRPCGTREPFLDENQGLKPLAILDPSLRDSAEGLPRALPWPGLLRAFGPRLQGYL